MPHVDDGQLQAWIDGETTGGETERIDRHLARCDACSARLEEVARVHARAGALIADARDTSVPAWEGLLARAADTAEQPAGEPEQSNDSATSSTGQVRGLWTPRLLTSGLAWAATLVLAFGLGWYAGWQPRPELRPEFRPGEARRSNAETQPEDGRSVANKRLAVEEQRDAALRDVAEQQPNEELSVTGETESGRSAPAAAPAAAKASVAAVAERNELAEVAAAEQEEPTRVAGQMLDRTESTPPPREQFSVAQARERQSDDEAAGEAGGARRADVGARAPEADALAAGADADEASMATPDIGALLGRAPLRLAGATLASQTVAPLATGPDGVSAPGVWMLFDDPQTGARVTVAQRHWPQDEASQATQAKDAETAVLTVIPGDAPQLWWITADSYLVLISADVDETTLRGLARRLR